MVFHFLSPHEIIRIGAKLSKLTRNKLKTDLRQIVEQDKTQVFERELKRMQEWHSSREQQSSQIFSITVPNVPLSKFGVSSSEDLSPTLQSERQSLSLFYILQVFDQI
jgi:hypothetical protein